MAERKSVVGLYLHSLGEDSKIILQGQIIGKDGDHCIVQTFSWMDGSDYSIVLIPFSDIANQKRIRLYADADQMKLCFEKKGGLHA